MSTTKQPVVFQSLSARISLGMKVIQHKKVSLTTESFQIATNMKVCVS
jgi:hypothetical protein